MGLLKKIFKPVSKVLDKIIPNEIKPLLPYASAFAPYMLPAGLSFGTGIMSNPMITRALASGGINALSQLAQEGNEGDLNAMSLGLASLQGAMGAEGAADKFRSWKNPGEASYTNIARGNVPGQSGGFTTAYDTSKLGFLDKAKNFGLEGLAKGSEFIGEAGSILRPGETPMTMKNIISAAALPFSMGTGEAMRYEADKAMEAYRLALAEYDAEQAALGGGTNEGRRAAILAAMKAYNHPEELIESTLEELGLRDGGRVGYAVGGGITDIFAEESFSKPDFGGIELAIGNVEEKNDLIASRQQDLFMMLEEAIMKGDDDKIFEIKSDWYKEFGIPMPMSENITEESVTQMAAQGGIMGYNNGGSVLPPGIEMDYRGGGFIPMGSQERADDVPARVSKNEFVMTADAVKAAGGGSVNKGAQRMYDLMNNLEARA
jgi:hypothetical protein